MTRVQISVLWDWDMELLVLGRSLFLARHLNSSPCQPRAVWLKLCGGYFILELRKWQRDGVYPVIDSGENCWPLYMLSLSFVKAEVIVQELHSSAFS